MDYGEQFNEKYDYPGNDLGAVYHPEKTAFRLWAPTAEEVSVKFYRSGDPDTDDCLGVQKMSPDVNGTWTAQIKQNLKGIY